MISPSLTPLPTQRSVNIRRLTPMPWEGFEPRDPSDRKVGHLLFRTFQTRKLIVLHIRGQVNVWKFHIHFTNFSFPGLIKIPDYKLCPPRPHATTYTDVQQNASVTLDTISNLTFWRRNYFCFNFSTPCLFIYLGFIAPIFI